MKAESGGGRQWFLQDRVFIEAFGRMLALTANASLVDTSLMDASLVDTSLMDASPMDTSLISAVVGAQTGMVQLAVAARLARMPDGSASSLTKLLDAAQQNFAPLANVAAGLGTNLDVSA